MVPVRFVTVGTVQLRRRRTIAGVRCRGAQRAPAWSPDGNLIRFVSNHEIIDNKAGVFQVYTLRADGSDVIRRTSDGVDKQNPAWIRRP
jgi:Tol biopolymer transport system component